MTEYAELGYKYYIMSAYVNQLMAEGARVVPLVAGWDQSKTEELLPHINGIFMPGGGSNYRDYAAYLMDRAVEINEAGQTFPVYGVCLGFENMGIWASSYDRDVLDKIEAHHVSMPLKFVVDPKDTKLFGDLGRLASRYEEVDAFYQSHSYSIPPSAFETDEGLKSKFRLTAIEHSTDDEGTPFTGAMESPDYPFFGTQFHPEKVPYTFNDNYGYNHSEESLILNDWFYRKFVSYARQNTNSYGNFAET
mmetsp:Transcript_82604/g.114166  ORF Transcript_82604/g.114166 Transcript_82604/m.114166 type:complete len:249 (+) Transcript_82604:209-955(+)